MSEELISDYHIIQRKIAKYRNLLHDAKQQLYIGTALYIIVWLFPRAGFGESGKPVRLKISSRRGSLVQIEQPAFTQWVCYHVINTVILDYVVVKCSYSKIGKCTCLLSRIFLVRAQI